jgi:hypothetical protein
MNSEENEVRKLLSIKGCIIHGFGRGVKESN